MKQVRSPKLLASTLLGLLLTFLQFNPINIGSKSVQLNSAFLTAQSSGLQSTENTLSTAPVTPKRLAMSSSRVAVSRPAPDALVIPTPTDLEEENFDRFLVKVQNGKADEVRGVYVQGVLALPIVQQPRNDAVFVSTEPEVATQFHGPALSGVIGLLAHNFLSGKLFYDLRPGQEARIVYGNGNFQRYRVSDVYQFQKLKPSSLRSELVDLSTGKEYSTEQVYSQFYRGKPHVTFQTCLERDGLSTWGLIFVVALPLDPGS